ncbi:MAG: sugar nucleotide-binding protein [Candidatus Wallbacteria bacterium]|nr:sugar nucleotide-binding protein [Candidatus Wallbacteria bacterium]
MASELTFDSRRPLLVLGGSGQVGGRVMAAAVARYGPGAALGTCHDHPTQGLIAADLRDPADLRQTILEHRPRAVVIAAAFAFVDGCETDPERAQLANVQGPRAVGEACAALEAVPVLLGTDYVFDGERGPYDEASPTCPINEYGRSKLEAERALAAVCPRSLTVRTNVVYSWLPGGNNFLMQVVSKLSRGERMRVPADQWNNPTYAPDLAVALLELLERGASGVVHFGGADVLERHDFGMRIARAFGVDPVGLEPVTTRELNQPAARPLRSGLLTRRFEALTGRRPMSVAEGIAAALAESRG